MEPVARFWGAWGCLGSRPGGGQGGAPGSGEREGQSGAGRGEHHDLRSSSPSCPKTMFPQPTCEQGNGGATPQQPPGPGRIPVERLQGSRPARCHFIDLTQIN